MAGKINNPPDFNRMGREVLDRSLRFATVHGLQFFQDSFVNQGFTDDALEAWEKRKGDVDPGRAVLIKTSALMDSLQAENDGKSRVRFWSDSPYGAIHNEGGTITINITPKARKYFWYMYKATGQERWKFMAIAKANQMKVTIPQRKFLGESKTLLKQIDNFIINEILKTFKNG